MYIERRKQLAEKLPEHCIALFFSEKAPYKVGDEMYEFSVDRNFYYLTGLDNEHMILAMIKVDNKLQEHLFIEHFDEEMAKWVGGRILPEEACTISEIQSIVWIEEAMDTLSSALSSYFNTTSQVEVYADFTKQEAYQADREAFRFTKEMLQLHPYVNLNNVAPYITALRLVKDNNELQKLKKAISITDEAIQAMMIHAKPGMYEYQIEAYFDFVLKSNDCDHSFPSIIAGGSNATILHYGENHKKVKNNTLILCDVGASYQYLNADITRTFPVNGRFTKRQREIYDIVLAGNKRILTMVRPGLTLRDLNNELIKFYQQELHSLGLLKRGKRVCDYYWHNVSHMLGLETHDVSLRKYQLQEGNVFTIEPGLYLEDEHIGIRIEDNVLVTKDGCINLSADIIKEPDEIEAFMKNNNIALQVIQPEI